MFSAVLALFLVAGSLALLFVLGSLLFHALQLPLGAALERRRFAACQARSRRGDERLRNGDARGALEDFRASFFLSTIGSRDLLSAVHNHHTGLLGRFIAVTEEVQGGGVRLMSLAKVDRLLDERTTLQRRYTRARDNGNAPRDVLRALRANRRELETALRQMVAEIVAAGVASARVH